MIFRERLVDWYQKNKRELPWRNTKDPYLIWLSEIILQQTRVNQGLDYYLKFAERFPNVKSLAYAIQDEVFKLWQGLGYYNRAENMLSTAKIIVEEYESQFPHDPDLLLKLPGIGPYTSAAIASIAFDIPVPVIDGNVYRVLARIFGIDTPVNTAKGTKVFYKHAKKLIDKDSPGIYNQAIMEFGALHCTPTNPDCNTCIFRTECMAYSKGLVKKLPVKKLMAKLRSRFFYYFLIEIDLKGDRYVYIKKRVNSDIWKNLYDFVLFESEQSLIVNDDLISNKLQEEFGLKGVNVTKVSKEYSHRLTHQLIHAIFIKINVNKKIDYSNEKSLILVNQNSLIDYPVPSLIERYLNDQKTQ